MNRLWLRERERERERDPLTDTVHLFFSGEVSIPCFVHSRHWSAAEQPCILFFSAPLSISLSIFFQMDNIFIVERLNQRENGEIDCIWSRRANWTLYRHRHGNPGFFFLLNDLNRDAHRPVRFRGVSICTPFCFSAHIFSIHPTKKLRIHFYSECPHSEERSEYKTLYRHRHE